MCQFHANLFKHGHPKGSETILKYTYMDDSMDSVMSEAELRCEVIQRVV